MAKPYSMDLRERAVGGESVRAIAQALSVSPSSVVKWSQRYCKTINNMMTNKRELKRRSKPSSTVRFHIECVAKLSLSRLANRDSVGLRR